MKSINLYKIAGLGVIFIVILMSVSNCTSNIYSKKLQKIRSEYLEKDSVQKEKLKQAHEETLKAKERYLAVEAEKVATSAQYEAKIRELKSLTRVQHRQLIEIRFGTDTTQEENINIFAAKCDSTEALLDLEKKLTTGLLQTVYSQQTELDECYNTVDFKEAHIASLNRFIDEDEERKKKSSKRKKVLNTLKNIGFAVGGYLIGTYHQ